MANIEIRPKQRYYYKGGVVLFDKEIAKWEGRTIAMSEAQARNNLAFQIKRDLDLPKASPIRLTGKVKLVGNGVYWQ